MKYYLTIVLCLFVWSSFAQEQILPLPDYAKNAIGIIAEPSFNNRHGEAGIGIQYKKWVRHNRAIRVNAAYSKWVSNLSPSPLYIYDNVLYEQGSNTEINMYMLD